MLLSLTLGVAQPLSQLPPPATQPTPSYLVEPLQAEPNETTQATWQPCPADAEEVQKLREEITRLQKEILYQSQEIERLKSALAAARKQAATQGATSAPAAAQEFPKTWLVSFEIADKHDGKLPPLTNLGLGCAGPLKEPLARVVKVIDAQQMVVEVLCSDAEYPQQSVWRKVWFRGIDTAGYSDDAVLRLDGLYIVTGTQQDGATTYGVLEPLPMDEWSAAYRQWKESVQSQPKQEP
jgi:hypothetical protein